MDGITQNQEEEGALSGGNGRHIKYRHALQLSAGGHTHTLEVEIPVPLGVDEETRAQLLREAEAGMSQLAEQVRRRFSPGAQREQAVQSSVPTPSATTKPVSRPVPTSAPQTSAPSVPPAAMRAQERSTSPRKETVVPPTRQSVGASMPTAPLAPGTGEMITIADFVKYIKENFNLLPNQAMALLGVKSLSGLNLREELRRLQILVAQSSATSESSAKSDPNEPPLPATRSSAPASNTPPPDEQSNESPAKEENVTVREERPVYIFDEEVGPDDDEEEDLSDGLEDLEDLEEEEGGSSSVARGQAEDILKKLRELRGATTVSASRLSQGFNNVVVDQIGDKRLQALINGVWGVTAPKRLKVDQAEELISWATREDDFVDQVDAVLALIEEERFARGNR